MTIRVVIADDQELIRSGLRTVLDAQPDCHDVTATVTVVETPVRWLRSRV